MRIRKSVRRLVLVGVASAAIAAPAAGAGVTPGTYVQIDGKLVDPARISAVEAQAGTPAGAHLVQVAGRLVRPEQVSAYQARLGRVKGSTSSADDDGIGWTTSTGIEIGVLSSLVLVAGTLGVLWRRGRPSTV
jgi:hypothetical protein